MEKKLSKLLDGENVRNIFLVRHPQVENYKSNVFNGRIDVGLSAEGLRQAEDLYRYFKDKVELVFTSPLKRCRVVAEKFDFVKVDERLIERSFGIFESLNWQQIEERYPKEAEAFLKEPFHYKPPKGESFYDVEKRIKGFVDELLKVEKDVLVVSHGGVNRIIIKLLLGLAEESLLKISQDYACINQFQTDGKFVLVKLLNGQVCFDRRV
ncbi:histidine phosphatase family protein [Hippea alviniae]|uniref:histidine phosphatase family protein n=1 Tax=Hippea alviniae TaxID=1279027 RepID=UPI0003B65825|nr:histidine phosphatase family protein [Hippea alviniae]